MSMMSCDISAAMNWMGSDGIKRGSGERQLEVAWQHLIKGKPGMLPQASV